MKKLLLLLSIIFSLIANSQAYEGFGALAIGGANSSTVYHVINLNATGAGSLYNGIGSNKTILFDVSGTINVRLDLLNITYLTIDAAGQNITINNNFNGDCISFAGANTHHCILKNVHVTGAGGDGINVVDGAHDIMITNCTSYGNNDGNIDVAGDNSGLTKNVTVQWCIIGGGKPNSSSYSGNMLITGQNVTAHHNLFVPATVGGVGERCPLVHCNYSPVGSPNADIRNNVIWKFGRDNGTGSGFGIDVAYSAAGNAVNNYVYTTVAASASNGVTTSAYGEPKGSLFASGNVSGNTGTNANSASNHAEYAIAPQFSVTMQDACTAAALVLAQAGPTTRNSIDQGFISGVTLPNCSSVPVNKPPVANAGPDIILTLPANSAALSGSGTDTDGTISAYAWSRVSGPTSFTLGNASTATTTLDNLVQGVYVFKLTVTDNGGASASDNVNVTVNASPNLPPIVNAGIDQTITLPTDSVTLMAQASDPDGSIASYGWTKVSGTGGVITTPSAPVTTITALSAGTYVYSLKVTDNKGASVSDNVTLTVIAAAPSPIFPVYFKVVYSDSTSKILKF